MGLTTGTIYKFKVQSRNEYGFSEDSDKVLILAAQIPDIPEAPTTTIVGPDVLIDWTAPNDRGNDILGYQIFIQQNDGDFSIDQTHCDGSEPDIITATSCLVPIAILIDSVYQLPWGSSIHAKVNAYN